MGDLKVLSLRLKQVIYEDLNPIAKSLGCELVLLDSKTYKSYENSLEQQIQQIGISEQEYRDLRDAIDDYGCIAILKSHEYISLSKMFSSFKAVGMNAEDDIHVLKSSDESKNNDFFYWFIVDVYNEDGERHLLEDDSMSSSWKVKFIDDDSDDYQIASFASKKDAINWIKNQMMQDKYDSSGFEVVEGPWNDSSYTKDSANEPTSKMKVWFDAIRPAPSGFKWIKNVEDFIDGLFADANKDFSKFDIISLDTKNDRNGHSFKDILNRAENDNVALLKVHVHGNDIDKKNQMLKQAKDNGWEIIDDLFEDKNGLNDVKHIDNVKLWVDDIRPAPKGYVWIKSVNDFIDYLVEHGIYGIEVFDFDHDAGEYANDGGDYIKCLDYLEKVGADNINVRIHSANPVGRKNMEAIINKNQWNEVFDIIDDDEIEESILDGGDYRALAQNENDEMINEVDVVASKLTNPTYNDLISSLQKIDPSTPIRILAVGHEAHTSNYYGHYTTIDHWKIDVNGMIVSNQLTKSGRWKCIVRDVPKDKACPAIKLIEWLQKNIEDLDEQIYIWPGFSSKGQIPLVDNRDNPTHIHKVKSFELSEEGTLDLNLSDVELCESMIECDQQLDETESVNEAEDAAKKDKIVSALKKASKDFQNAASNYDPEQFAKIVVAFDDLTAGVGKYDFKKKKVLKEVEEDKDDDLEDQLKFDEIAEAMHDAGISDVSVEFEPGKKTSINIDIPQKIVMHGSFDDKYPLDTLNFHWHDKDENTDAGWYEGTRCMNKWRRIGKQILDRILPTGFPDQLLDNKQMENEDGVR